MNPRACIAVLSLLGALSCGKPHVAALDADHPSAWKLPEPTTGRIAGFRSLVDTPEALIAQLTAEADTDAPPGPRGDLAIRNLHSAYADVRLGEVAIGRIEPYADAAIRDLPVGTYTLELTLPNGFVRTEELEVREGDVASPTDAVRAPP